MAAVAISAALLAGASATPAQATRCNWCDEEKPGEGGPVPTNPVNAVKVISPDSLDGRHVLIDGDSIETSVTAIEPGQMQFRLIAAPNVRWWKEIQIFDGFAKAQDFTQDDRKCTMVLTVNTRDLSGSGVLIFSKAKFLGIHTGMYEIHNLRQFDGRRLDFTWTRDA